ncbi:MAG: riboflavin synthase, partial [Angustibacter sp.]
MTSATQPLLLTPERPAAVRYEGLVTMFTGIVEELGKVSSFVLSESSAQIAISASTVLTDLELGSSISVDGVCLTVIEIANGAFVADVMNETLVRSTLAGAGVGRRVNLERPMLANGRFGGHIVAGHVDDTTLVRARVAGDQWDILTF